VDCSITKIVINKPHFVYDAHFVKRDNNCLGVFNSSGFEPYCGSNAREADRN